MGTLIEKMTRIQVYYLRTIIFDGKPASQQANNILPADLTDA